MNKTLTKYIAAFDYSDKTLLVLSTASGGVPIASFATVNAPVGLKSGSLSFLFSVLGFLLQKAFKKMEKKRKKIIKLFYWHELN